MLVTTIIAGRFQQQSEVEESVEELQRAGFTRDRIAAFFLNPQGQHDTYSIGGDRAMSPGAKETDAGAATGAVVGGAAGLAATPMLGPVGPVTGGLVGAYVGGLIGGVSKMKEHGDTGKNAEDQENAAPVRHSGMYVAAAVDTHEQEEQAIHALRALGAADIERSEGTLVDSDWQDFNPLSTPVLVDIPREQWTNDDLNRHV